MKFLNFNDYINERVSVELYPNTSFSANMIYINKFLYLNEHQSGIIRNLKFKHNYDIRLNNRIFCLGAINNTPIIVNLSKKISSELPKNLDEYSSDILNLKCKVKRTQLYLDFEDVSITNSEYNPCDLFKEKDFKEFLDFKNKTIEGISDEKLLDVLIDQFDQQIMKEGDVEQLSMDYKFKLIQNG